MGGKSKDDSSRQMIQMQKQEAAEARAKEAARQGRISSGLDRIRNAFEGAPIMRNVTRNYSFGGAPTGLKGGEAVSGLPPGFSYVNTGGTTSSAPTSASRLPGAQPQTTRQGGQAIASQGVATSLGNKPQATKTTGGGWMIRGPDGRLYRPGENISYGGEEDTGGRSGGIGADFYNRFKQGILDYYNPQVQEQYGKAKNESTFRHARAGTLRSSSAATNAADLAKQKDIREGEVLSKADTAAADLKNRVATERQKAESQLYATENPDVAANQALSAITNISAEQPSLTPLGEIFDVAAVGGANFMKGAQNARFKQYVPGQGGYGATKVV